MFEIYETCLKLVKQYFMFKVCFTKFHICYSRVSGTCGTFSTSIMFLSKKGQVVSPILKHNIWWLTLRHIPLPLKMSFRLLDALSLSAMFEKYNNIICNAILFVSKRPKNLLCEIVSLVKNCTIPITFQTENFYHED
jgi:hypothetical protein